MNYKKFCEEYELPYWDEKSRVCYELWMENLPKYDVDELAKKGPPFILFDPLDPDHWFILISWGTFIAAVIKFLA